MGGTPTASAITELSSDSGSQNKGFLFEITYFIFMLVKNRMSLFSYIAFLSFVFCSSSVLYFTTLESLQFKRNIFFVFPNRFLESLW